MHDRHGRDLKKGDLVLIPAVVQEVYATDEYCNCQLGSVFGRRPDGQKETIYSINTGMVIRANNGDEIDLVDMFDAAGK